VAKLLRHRRHGSGHAYGLDVRSDNLDRADTNIVTQEPVTVFTTSNVFHFGAVLLAAGILSAPWHAGLLLGLAGLAGVTYMLIVLWLARHRLDYQPVLSDWLWYTVLPRMTCPVFCASARKECYADGNSATKALFFCPRLSLRNPRPGASRFFKIGKTLLFSPQDVQTSNLMLRKIISRDGCRPRRLGFRNQTSIWPSTSSTAWCSLRRSASIADGSAICSRK
jgi:hypothetical protein